MDQIEPKTTNTFFKKENDHGGTQRTNGKSPAKKKPATPLSAIKAIGEAARTVAKLVAKAEKVTGGASDYSRQAVTKITELNGILREWENNL